MKEKTIDSIPPTKEKVNNFSRKKKRVDKKKERTIIFLVGYKNYYQVLNAKNYGVPQNRERVFTVSIRLDMPYCWAFKFPARRPLTKRLKDVLGTEVDEKYYLSDKVVAGYMTHTNRHKKRGNGFKFEPTDGNVTAHTISTRAGQRPTDNYVAIKTANKTGYDLATDGDGIDLAYPDSKTRRGRVGHGVSKTLPTSDSQGVMDGYRIRKLTPLECWRLMGFDDTDFRKAEKVNSNTQLYKQAGNSIVVNVLEAILKELIDGSAD